MFEALACQLLMPLEQDPEGEQYAESEQQDDKPLDEVVQELLHVGARGGGRTRTPFGSGF